MKVNGLGPFWAAVLAVGIVQAQTDPRAQMISPIPGSTLPAGAVTFTWSAGAGGGDYFLTVESIPGSHDIFNAVVRVTSVTLGPACNVPNAISPTTQCILQNGEPIYATLWTQIRGVWQTPFQYTYTAFNLIPTITSVNTAGGFPDIAQNSWIEIKGTGLAPSSLGPNGMTWSSAPEFDQGRMPTQLSSVSVKVNGKSAYVYYISETQINVLTPLDGTQGQVSIVVTNGTKSSAPFAATMRAVAPSLLLFGASKSVVATHANGSLLGPASMSVPGYSFTPAQAGETVVLYAVGFGLPTSILVEGSATQSGELPTLPVIQIGGASATVEFAGVISPGLYQFNVIVPRTVANGDNPLSASYSGFTTASGSVIVVQR